MINQRDFELRLQSFPKRYIEEFDYFWKWKLGIENDSDHILSEGRREEAFNKLKPILLSWQAYRGSRNRDPWRTLEESLRNISLAFDRIRRYALLQFSEIPDEPLKLIWHELGRVKEYRAERNKDCYYFVIAVSKPLMLLWGQTLAFDSHVRNNLPTKFNAPKSSRWSYEQWKTVMRGLESEMKKSPLDISQMNQRALERYQSKSVIPYGRFLDMYYF